MKDYTRLLDLFTAHLGKHTTGLDNRQPAELYEPERYILSLGGKRLRPMLTLMACELFGKDPADALDAALAVELFHNFSLIHDDILDAAPLRRSHPTVHTKWNTNIAILSGDVMLVKAFQALEHYEPGEFKQLTALLHRTAIEVCEGQQMDMNFETATTVSASDYIQMISRKTSVLLGCSLQMGAINAKASVTDQELLYSFGNHLGISFQLLDDLLDAFPGDTFGKQIGGDIRANKKTFLLLKAIELANPSQLSILHALLEEQDQEKKVNGMLAIFSELSVEKLCRDKAARHTEMALDMLEKTTAAPAKKETLRQLTRQLLDRQI